MRLSLRRSVQWVLILVLLQVAVYYWSVSVKRPESRRNKEAAKSHPYLQRFKGEGGTCSFKNCPAVREDVLNVHFVPHSHIDVGWLKTVDQYYAGAGDTAENTMMYGDACVKCTIEHAIQQLLENPKRTFIFVEMKYLSRYWNELDADNQTVIKNLIKERRLELINGGWVMSDAGVTMYNDIIDQHTLGFDFIKDTFGPCAQTRTGWHVDQFGHSREHASIFAQMGYDSLFVGRIDYEDHSKRKAAKELELLWKTSPNNYGDRSWLFTHATYDGYYAPPSYVFENTGLMSKQNEMLLEDFKRILFDRARAYQTNHLMVPMGSDFGYIRAHYWYQNMDLIIEYLNKKFGKKINVLYSTPSCYTYHVNKANKAFPAKTDDFHPYGIEPNVYWTGYFTTRGGFKLHVRQAGQILQSCKQLSIFVGLKGTYDDIHTLKDAMGVMQHHDAITGTQKLHVLQDYNKLLSRGEKKCENVMGLAYNQLWAHTTNRRTLMPSPTFCPALNISDCEITTGSSQFMVTAYNPLAWPVTHYISVPVTRTILTVTDHTGIHVSHQLSRVPEGIRRIPERRSVADVNLVFEAVLPPMSVNSYVVNGEKGGVKPEFEKTKGDRADIIIENEHLKLTFSGSTGFLMAITDRASQKEVKLNQTFMYYEAFEGGPRSSGAYVFIPSISKPYSVATSPKIDIQVVRGDIVEEVHQTFSPWVSQVVRLYRDAKYGEFEWVVGPLDKSQQGKEVISLFTSELENKNIFYTDSNGREMMKRKRVISPAPDFQLKDNPSANYYPVTKMIYIRDVEKDLQLTVLPDRPQGGSALNPGAIELMVHRACRFDDGLGVGESLEDRGVDRKGIIYTGKHWLHVGPITKSVEETKLLGFQNHLAPTVMLNKILPQPGHSNVPPPQATFLSGLVPPNLHILTLDTINQTKPALLLLRIEHVFERDEHPEWSQPAVLELENLFRPFTIDTVEETTLGGNFHPEDIHRMKWRTNTETTCEQVGLKHFKEELTAPFNITLQPMEIRTFRVQVSRLSRTT